jgi:single-stranded-DNA-specific exonuclease
MFYLLSVLRSTLRERGWFGTGRKVPNLAAWLDLVALGTVADLVPLDHNNRVLVRQGIERIRRGLARPGLLALMRLGKRDYRHTVASDLGFAVAPRLNAAGRLEDMGAGIQCLLEDDPERAMERASELDALNSERKTLQDRMQQEAMAQVQRELERLGERERLPDVLCLFDEQWHQGIVGLVASRVKDSVHRPVVAFAPEEEGADKLKGSARSVRGLHMRDVLALIDARHAGLMSAFGGHAMAAGLSLQGSRLEDFRRALADAVATILDGESLQSEVLTDGELEPAELGLDLARRIEKLGPWGQKFPEPLFDGRFRVLDARVVGGAHLKMVVRHVDGGPEVDAIAFGRLPEDLPEAGVPRFLYRLSVNRWRGEQSCQLMVESILSPD